MSPAILLLVAVVVMVVAVGLLFLFPAQLSQTSGAEGRPKSTSGEDPFQGNFRQREIQEKQKEQLRKRLVQAGFYGRSALVWVTIVKLLSFVIPFVMALLVSSFSSISIRWTSLIAFAVALAGVIGPSFLLDHMKKKRQIRLRRSIPDALDVLSICLEAGMSLPLAILRVSQELATAHPELAFELAIVNRETLLGRSVGESMRSLAERFDIEELRSMSTVILQAERYGSSLSDAMEVFASSMRQKRMYAAEAKAQQAVAKILIPTVLCILPSLFLVTLGPAIIMIIRGLESA